MNRILFSFAAFAITLGHSAGWVSATTAHVDISVARTDGGQLVIGAADVDLGALNFPNPIFEGEVTTFNNTDANPGFGSDRGALFTGDEPGHTAPEQDEHDAEGTGLFALPGNTPVSFDFKSFEIGGESRNLWFWDGNATVDFGAPDTGDVVEAATAARAITAFVDGTDNDVSGFTIATTDADGGIHDHLDWSVFDKDDLTAPLAGIYLVGITHSVAGLTDSEIAYIVFGVADENDPSFSDDELETAIEAAEGFVESNLLGAGGPNNPAIPEPATATLLAIGVAMLTRRQARC